MKVLITVPQTITTKMIEDALKAPHIKELISNGSFFGEFGNKALDSITKFVQIDMHNASHKITELILEYDKLHANIETLSTISGRQLQHILSDNEKFIKFTLRAIGRPNESMHIITVDAEFNTTYATEIMPYMENKFKESVEATVTQEEIHKSIKEEDDDDTVRIYDDQRIFSNDVSGYGYFQYLDYNRAIQYVALLHGFDITLRQADDIWSEVSDENYCSWMGMDLTDYDGIWEYIKPYFNDIDEEDVEIMNNKLFNKQYWDDYIVTVNVIKKETQHPLQITIEDVMDAKILKERGLE